MPHDFLKEKYGLHKSPEVDSAVRREEKRTGEKIPQDPSQRIGTYLYRLNEIVDRKDPAKRERGITAIKRLLYKKFVIEPEEIPESYFEQQRRLAREQGRGDIEITKEMKDQLSEVIISDQKSSLDAWVDYLASDDAAYPDWLKYFAIRSVLQMGEYNKEKKAFRQRSKGTTKPFPDLNREALAYVLDAIAEKYGRRHLDLLALDAEEKQEFEKLLASENFAKLYAWALEKTAVAPEASLGNTEGRWVRYPKDSDHMSLVRSLARHNTGWCTAGEMTAETQLRDGDFYVYYSLDKEGKPTIPRAAIRMQGDTIAEVRGIAPDQNLDPFVAPVVEAKLKEFPDGASYEKKVHDMKRLTEIERRKARGEPLQKDDLRFLYEIDGRIEGFGYVKDPRVGEILDGRSVKADLAFVLDTPEGKISMTTEEVLQGGAVYHYGDLILWRFTSAEGLTLPKHVGGYLDLSSLTSAEGLKLPEHIGGGLSLDSLTSAEGLKLPKHMGGDLDLSILTSAEGLTLPEHVGGDLYLGRLTSAEGLTLPEHVGGDLYLGCLTSDEIKKIKEQYPALRIYP